MKKLYRNAKRFMVHCRQQWEMEQREDARRARIVARRLKEEARRREAREAIRDGCL